MSPARDNPFGDGAGMLHDWIFDAAITLKRTRVVVTPAATHQFYRVGRLPQVRAGLADLLRNAR